MSKVAAYAKLVERGCLCASDRSSDCPLHEAGDNRGLRAYYEAGMPNGFPMQANCALCGADGLMYPDVELDAGEDGDGPTPHRPTLICPRCSGPTAEAALLAEVAAAGIYVLNDRRVFGAAAGAAA